MAFYRIESGRTIHVLPRRLSAIDITLDVLFANVLIASRGF